MIGDNYRDLEYVARALFERADYLDDIADGDAYGNEIPEPELSAIHLEAAILRGLSHEVLLRLKNLKAVNSANKGD